MTAKDSIDDGCVLGTKNEERVRALERDMGKVGRFIVALVICSFTTLGSAITGLVITLVNKG